MPSEPLADFLDVMSVDGLTSGEWREAFLSARTHLFSSREVVEELVGWAPRFGQDGMECETDLFGMLLDEARMGLENNDALAPGFLEAVEQAIGAKRSAGVLDAERIMVLAALWHQAGLAVPECLKIDPETVPVPEDVDGFDPSGGVGDMFRELMSEGGSPHEAFMVIDGFAAAWPDEGVALLARELATSGEAVSARCALYYLVSGNAAVQEAVLSGLSGRLAESGLDANAQMFLPVIRGWMPAGPNRAVLDGLIRKMRGRQSDSRAGVGDACTVHEVRASVCDGVGAQGFMILAERGGRFSCAMVLAKEGHGVKDAFVVDVESRTEVEDMMRQYSLESSAFPVTPETFRVLVEGALGEGRDHGRMPPPGLLDVMESCGLVDLRPQSLGLEELMGLADPDRFVRDASAWDLKRWIDNDIALYELGLLACHWFENSAATRQIIEKGDEADEVETKIRNHVDGRRDIWMRRFLQTAVILRDARRVEEWRMLVASAHGLAEGRPVERIPLMEDIVGTTIYAAHMDAMSF